MKHTSLDQTSSHRDILKREDQFFYASILPFCAFAAMVFLPYGDTIVEGLLSSAFIMTALLSGGVILYSMVRKVSRLFMNITFAALITRCIWEARPETLAIGAVAVCVYILVYRLIDRQNEILCQNIRLKIEHRNVALTDPLTRLGNRRLLDLFGDRVFASEGSAPSFHVVIFDIDFFKLYNDTHGHLEGDKLLRKVGQILASHARSDDLVVRLGGEEFLVVLSDIDQVTAIQVGERIAQSIKEETSVTVSVGVSSFEGHANLSEVVNDADMALYRAKEAGRDQLVLAS